MTQETEKEDPRQSPPKQFGGTQPGQGAGSGSKQPGPGAGRGTKPGGMHDDLDESRGATDRESAGDDTSGERSAGSGSTTGSQSGKGGGQQQGEQESNKQDKGSSNRTGSGSSSRSGGAGSSDSKR